VQHEISEASKRSKQNYKSSSWLSLLDTEAATWVDILVREEVNRALHRSDLDKLLELIDVLPADLRASDQLGLSNDRVATVLRAFYASLFSTVTAQFDRLQDPALRERMRNGIADELAAAHAKVSSATMFYDFGTAVCGPSGVEMPAALFPMCLFQAVLHVSSVGRILWKETNLHLLPLLLGRCTRLSRRRVTATTRRSSRTACRRCECCWAARPRPAGCEERCGHRARQVRYVLPCFSGYPK
jgi:hypothetical protein